MSDSEMSYDDAVNFHGHSCPGLAIGFRAAEVGLKELFGSRSQDEEMVAIVENDACGVDAVQLLTGCTCGKGNLIFRDYGKMAFTFFNRNTGCGIRVYVEPPTMDEQEDSRFSELKGKTQRSKTEQEEMSRIMKKRTKFILDLQSQDFIKTGPPQEPMPRTARLFNSSRCPLCGEQVMETRMVEKENISLCISCSQKGPEN